MKFVPDGVSRAVARQSLNLSKNSPNILFGVGVVGVIGTTVLASKATLELTSVLNSIDEDLALSEHIRKTKPDEYSQESLEKDQQIIRVQGVIKVAKLYAPAVICGAVSIAALTKSHSILNSRNASLTAAYAALDQGFRQYRARVVEELGAEKDQEFRYGSEELKFKDPETGKKVTVKTVGPDGSSIYARFFDEANANWNGNSEYNMLFLKNIQNWANDKLRVQGYLMLNDVYEMLGIPKSKAGAVVGWVFDPRDNTRDSYIDFGLFDGTDATKRFFVNGDEVSILLDFNVDGIVFELIDEIERAKQHA